MIFSPSERAATAGALLALTKNPPADLTRALADLVPHLHPVDAATRFGALQDTCADAKAMTLHARGHAGDDAARVAADHWADLIQRRLGEMFTPTTAYHDNGSQWSAADTRRMVGAGMAVAA